MGIIITWENADDFKLVNKRFRNLKDGNFYYLSEKCVECGNPYFSKTKKSTFCSNKCSGIVNSYKLKYEDIKLFVESIGFYLLDNEFKGQKYGLTTKCKTCGYITKKLYGNLKKGQIGCNKCLGRNVKTWDEILHLFNKYNFDILTPESEYKSANHTKIKYKCKICGHNGSISYTRLKHRGKRCYNCNKPIQKNKIKFQDIKKWFEDEGWTVHSTENDYKNQNATPIDCSCPNGHRQQKWVRKWRLGRRCPFCVTSGDELQLRNYIEELGIEVIFNSRKYLNGQELDMYFPSLNKAIEFNGDYWHCNYNFYDKNYYHKHKGLYASELWVKDHKKKVDCKKFGIELLVIWEHNWKNYIDDTKVMIDRFLRN